MSYPAAPIPPTTPRHDLNAVIADTTASLIVVLDHDARILHFNRACEAATGYRAADVLGQSLFERLIPDDQAPALRRLFDQILAGQIPCHHENDWLARDGTRRHIVWSGNALRDDAGQVQLIVGCGNDITDRRKIELKLRESEERYALAVRGANDGIWDWDLRTDNLYLSPRWKAMLGHADDELRPSPDEWFDRVHPDDLPRLRTAIAQHLAGETPHVEIEHRVRHKAAHYRWMLARGLAIRGDDGQPPYRIAGSLTDVTDRKAVEERLVKEALFDSLTGLANRLLVRQRVETALARSRRDDAFRFAVLFLDLDRFKVVNDGLGHHVGDQLLVEFARRLERTIRPLDTVARLGGDEFVVLLENVQDEAGPVRVAQRVHDLLRAPFALGDHEVFTTASIGIAPGSPRYRDVGDILRDADAAMYRAKALGKNRHEMFDTAMHERAIETLKLETDLRRAIDRGEFFLHYQPLVSLKDGHIKGFEALVRWRHPDRGLVSPATFIPVLEETGLIVPLGNWVLFEACRQLQAWREQFPALAHLAISVNVSGRQFGKSNLAAEVDAVLAATALPPRNLTLEITESVMVTNADYAADALRQLRGQGVTISVDDFGVGYSSLSQLHKFPIDALKIDRSFLQRIDAAGEDRDAEIVRTIVTLAHNLHLHVTAEGVETPLQLERLKQLGCQTGQGYLFAKPLLPEEVESLLTAQASQTPPIRAAG